MVQCTGLRKEKGHLVLIIKTAVNHLMENCNFSVGNVTMKQEIAILMGIDSAPFLANLVLYSCG